MFEIMEKHKPFDVILNFKPTAKSGEFDIEADWLKVETEHTKSQMRLTKCGRKMLFEISLLRERRTYRYEVDMLDFMLRMNIEKAPQFEKNDARTGKDAVVLLGPNEVIGLSSS